MSLEKGDTEMTSKLSNDNLRRASLLGLFSASVLLTLATTPVHAADQAVTDQAGAVSSLKATPTDQSGDVEAQVKAITRTIEYTNPETGKDVQVRQVVKYQQKAGETIPLTDTAWPEYFAPEFKGYQTNQVAIRAVQTNAQSEDEVVQIKYYPFNAQTDNVQRPISIVFEAAPASSGVALDSHDIKRMLVNINTADPIDLPTPPEGWEYVNKNLPAKIRFFSGGGSVLRLRVQKINPVDEYQEKRQLERTIIFHLPSGDQSVVQRAVAKRTIKTHGDDKETGPWVVESFVKIMVPTVDGYTPSMAEIPAFQVPADQLSTPVLPIEVSYQAISEPGTDSQMEPEKTGGTGSQTDTTETKEETTETTPTEETGIQTDSTSQTDSESQTEPVEKEDTGSQTDTTETKEETTETTPSEEEGTQTDSTSQTDGESQTEPVEKEDTGSQTDETETKNEATGTTPTGEVGTQTDSTSQADGESQTELVEKEDAGSQTDPIETNESGTQTGTSEVANSSSQTPDNNQDDPSKIVDKDLTTDTKENNRTDEETGKGMEAPADQSEVTNDNYFIPLNKVTASEQALPETVDPVAFHNALSPFQDSLKKLGNEQILPQTGNQTNTKTSLAGLLLTLLTATASLFALKKRS